MIKKMSLIAMFFVINKTSFAEENKDSTIFMKKRVFIGADLNTNLFYQKFNGNSYDKSYGFSTYDKIGYFITNNLALGSAVKFSINKEELTNYYNFWSYSIALMPFLRYYFFRRFYVNGEVGYGASFGSIGNSTFLSKNILGEVSIGNSILLKENIFLDFHFAYSFRNNNNSERKAQSNVFDSGLGVIIIF